MNGLFLICLFNNHKIKLNASRLGRVSTGLNTSNSRECPFKMSGEVRHETVEVTFYISKFHFEEAFDKESASALWELLKEMVRVRGQVRCATYDPEGKAIAEMLEGYLESCVEAQEEAGASEESEEDPTSSPTEAGK